MVISNGINLRRRIAGVPLSTAAIIKCARRAWRIYGKRRPDLTELSLVLTTDQEVRRLNRRYRRRDASTDVLSFDYGEIIISYPTAKKQAKFYGHSLEKELCKLVVHGALHILGFDHNIKSDKIKMVKAETRVLRSGGLIERLPPRLKPVQRRP